MSWKLGESSEDEREEKNETPTDMQQYQNELIQEITEPKEENLDDEDIKDKIEAVKQAIKKAKHSGEKKSKIKQLKRELEDLKIQQKFKNIDVDLKEDVQERSIENDEEEMDLTNFWHYKVMHTDFVGENSINLTNDDSDEKVFLARTNFIEEFCDKTDKFHEMKNSTADYQWKLKIYQPIWQTLFPHQRGAIQWLWDLYQKNAGGIEGDEMGLGKTCICSVFVGSLIQSGIIDKPTLVLCPLTVCQQWIRELHIWCPWVKSVLLHETRTNKDISKEDLLRQCEGTTTIVVSNYDTILHMQDTYSPQMVDWACVICDEAHKIKNNDTSITKLVKKLTAKFRLAVTGSPIQNNLLELWSLFDFCYPGLLGTMDVFEEEFADPIRIGSYANANHFQVFRAYYCAQGLRDLIKPYLLRRVKSEVHANLPTKSEQIFFCHLTKTQVRLYEEFLESKTVYNIINGNGDMFAGSELLRQICNHPFIFNSDRFEKAPNLSCKTKLMMKILPEWAKNHHRALIFSQSLQMLDIIGEMLDGLGLDYFRMDGGTPTIRRTQIMDLFNSGERFCCILSTKVGGLGVNLVGADRVIIVDPDWNPSTDAQALERAYRIGQTKDVSVYRLICIGTIEEKIYKKQIFKQFLSNKIMQNPNQRRLFAPSTVRDLFTLEIEGDHEVSRVADDLEKERAEEEKKKNGDKAVTESKSQESLDNPQEQEKVDRKEELEENEDDREAILEAYENKASEDEEDDSKDNSTDKNIIKSLLEGGSIEKVLHQEDLFKQTLDTTDLSHKRKAEVKANEAKRKLKSSVGKGGPTSISRKHAHFSANVDEVQDMLVRYFKSKGGKATTQEILDNFRNHPLTKKDPGVIRMVLHRVSVLNKRTKVWYLIGRYT